MNKQDFIQKLSEKTGYSVEQCEKVNEILESIPAVGKNNKEKIVEELKSKLNLPDDAVDKLYDAAMGIIGGGILDKLKHPFGNKS